MSKKDEEIHGIKLKTIVFSFREVLKNGETREAFMNYLKTEHNTEPLEFLDEHLKLTKIPTEDITAQITQLMHIVTTFIGGIASKDAPKLLNICAHTCQTIRNEILSSSQHTNPTQWVITKYKSPQHLLMVLYDAINFELRHDSFPRFVRSKIFREVIGKKDAAFVRAISTPQATIEFDYKDSDFTKHIVYDKDFRFFEKLAVDSYDWELQGFQRLQKESSAISGFFSTRNYLANVSWAKQGSVAKFSGVLPYNFDFVAETILPGCNIIKLDANSKKIHEYHFYDNASMQQTYPDDVKTAYRSTGVISFETFLPFPMKQTRRYLNATSVEYSPEKEQIILIHKPCELQEAKWALPKGHIDMYSYCCKILRKIDENTTYFCEVHLFNLGGWATNNTLQKLIIFDRAKELQKRMLAFLKQAKAGELKLENEKDFILQTLRDTQVAKRREEYMAKLKEQGEDAILRRKSSLESNQ